MKIASSLLKKRTSFTNSVTALFRKYPDKKAGFHEAQFWMEEGYKLAIRRLEKNSL